MHTLHVLKLYTTGGCNSLTIIKPPQFRVTFNVLRRLYLVKNLDKYFLNHWDRGAVCIFGPKIKQSIQCLREKGSGIQG